MPCASKPNIIPPSTSPAPAVAKVGGALALMMARPSGAAMTVSAPFSTITAPLVRAAARARVSLSPLESNRRANSPSCGVSTQAPRMALEQLPPGARRTR